MPEIGTRYPCPVCLGAKLNKIMVGVQAPVEIDHCRRCGGVWLEHGEIPRLRLNPPAALWAEIARRKAKAASRPATAATRPSTATWRRARRAGGRT